MYLNIAPFNVCSTNVELLVSNYNQNDREVVNSRLDRACTLRLTIEGRQLKCTTRRVTQRIDTFTTPLCNTQLIWGHVYQV